VTTTINPSGNQDIDGLLNGYSWSTVNLTYSFPTGISEYNGYAFINGFQAFNAAQQTAVARIIDNINSVSGLNITRTTGAGASIRYAEANSIDYGDGLGTHTVATAEGNPPDPNTAAYRIGDTWFNHTNYDTPNIGSYAYSTIIHETGHALGLKHGHVSQGAHGSTFPALPANHNSFEYSVMTYSQYVGDNPNNGDNAVNHPTSLMQDDIIALQYMYGANYSYHATSDTYTWSPTTGEMFVNGAGQGRPETNTIFLTVWDGGGVDTYNFANYTTGVTVDLRPGEWSGTGATQTANLGDGHLARGSIANALMFDGVANSIIENAIGGTGSDTIRGNFWDNELTGLAGNDTLNGDDGNDTLNGGPGGDTLIGGNGYDFATYASAVTGVSADLLYSAQLNSGEATGDTYSGIEAIAGSAWSDALNGDNSANSIYGSSGNDTIYGRGGADSLFGNNDNDVLNGGAGADLLDGGNGFDFASYQSAPTGVSVDLLYPQVNSGDAVGDTYVSIEAIVGSDFADGLFGTDGNDVMYGGAGNDTMYGRGGNDSLLGTGGNDTIVGGTGNDVMYGDQGSGVDNDVFWFDANGFGRDVIQGFGANSGANHDVLVFQNSVYASFAAFMASAQQMGTDVVAYHGTDSLQLVAVQLAALTADDFAFYA
jgi:serralysin